MFDALAHQQTSVKELMLKTSPIQTLYGGQFTLSAQRIKPKFFFIFFFILGSEAVTVHEMDWQKKGLPSGKEMNLVKVVILNRVAKIQQIRIALVFFFHLFLIQLYTYVCPDFDMYPISLSSPRTQTVLQQVLAFCFLCTINKTFVIFLKTSSNWKIVSLPNFPMLKKPIIMTTHLLLLQGGDWKHGRIGCDYSIVFFALHHHFCCYVTENGSFCWTIEDQELFKAITVVLAADG